MTDEKKVVGDDALIASGEIEKSDKVSYEAHQRLLSQRKKDQERLAALENEYNAILEQKKSEEEAKLSQKGEYQKIIELREQRIKELEEKVSLVNNKYQESENRIINARKLAAFNSKLPARIVDNDYYDLVRFDEIAVDPETNEIDESSVDKLVQSFVKKHGRLLETRTTKMPNEATISGSTKIDYDEWVRLPFKEQKKYKWDDLKNLPKT